ncbi:MAG: pyroglutamyl-peptidase I [Bifidobacteriaceae bacterium]|nr:pyroglutamyl-peptidase I [Bifidobacteriaceae bacterium]
MEQFEVVISGFDPYDGVEINPSREVPMMLQRTGIPDTPAGTSVRVTSVMLPMSFAKAWPTLYDVINTVHPQIIIATGLKRRNRGIALERCATNIIDADKPDADNVQPRRVPITPSSPAAYWTGLPLRDILDTFAAQNIPATLSSDAGTYVCNSLFYRLLDWTAAQSRVVSGFLSFPMVNEKRDNALGIPLGQMVQAAQDVVCASIEYCRRPPSGEMHMV